MPRAKSWLPRFPLIVEALEASTVTHFKRAEIEKLFGIGVTAAKELMSVAGSVTPGGPGTEAVIFRESLLYYLRNSPEAQDAMQEVARRKRLAEALRPDDERLRMKAVRLPCSEADEWAGFQDLPGVTLSAGLLMVSFSDPLDLMVQLYRLSKAAGADWEAFLRMYERIENDRSSLIDCGGKAS